jgi:hypothetical protein
MKRASAALVLLGLALAVLLLAGQAPFPASYFDFGHYREYEGALEAWPYPMLLTGGERYLLVAPGKHGLDSGQFAGQHVRLKGALISRGSDQMLEVLPESMAPVAGAARPDHITDLGEVTLKGEIVDSKCYLGVMNPGNGKVHRDCAVRCISGGAPPAFIAQDSKGDVRVLLLTGSDGRALNREILSFVAEPLELTGRLARRGDSLFLLSEPSTFRRE